MIHDLVPVHFPEWVHARTRRMHGAKYKNAARSCDVVIVNSHFTADDVADTLGIPPERIHVAYPGVDPEFTADGDRLELGRPYALTVATLEPRKNLAGLVEAHRRLNGDLALVVAGAAGWGEQAKLDVENIVRLGYTLPEDLPRLYRGASVVVYPSLYEGFGMPVVEAMACGVPVVASSHPSLDEASGHAAMRADPEDPDAIAAAMRIALERRDELVVKGLEHARAFTWLANGRAHVTAWESAR
jgi:alpha-1,3-rhamnosyl/mannosyltransferase